MWPFNKKKSPNEQPTLILHGINQKLIFIHHPEIVFYIDQISYHFENFGVASIRIEAHEL